MEYVCGVYRWLSGICMICLCMCFMCGMFELECMYYMCGVYVMSDR